MSGAADTEETDPNFNQTVLLLHGDGTNGGQNNTFIDSSPTGRTLTRNGNLTQGTFNPFLGDGQYSNFFDGSNDFITMPNVSDLNLVTGNFTIDFFIYPTDSGNNRMIIGGTSTQDYINLQNANTIQVVFSSSGDSKTFSLGTTITNKWSHIAVVRKNSTTCEVFLDGVSKGTNTIDSNSIFNSQSGFIGKWGHNDSYWYKGYISNLRIISGSNIYSGGNFTPSSTVITTTTGGATASEVELLTCQSNRFLDNSNNGNALTITGAPKVVPFSPFAPTASYSESVHGGSGYFDQADDYVETPNASSDFNLGTGQFTIEAWIYTQSTDQQTIAIPYGDTPFNIYLHDDAVHLYSSSVIIDGNSVSVESFIQKHAWNHVVVQRDSSNYLTLYVNGVRKYHTVDVTDFSANNKIRIGKHSQYTNEFKGYISSLRFVQGSGIYSGATITLPSAPHTSTGSETKLLLNFTNASIIDNTMKNNGETIEHAQLDTTVKKFGTASMEFDGSGDYVRFHNNPLFTFGTGDFTIECFVYFNNTSGGQYICGQSHSDAASDTSVQIYLDSGTIYGWVGTGSNEVTASVFSATTWVHLAFVRQGANIRLYYDGVQQNSTNIGASYSPTVSTGPFSIGTVGNYASGALNAFIDEFRVTKGICRYPDGTSFTAPTKAFANK